MICAQCHEAFEQGTKCPKCGSTAAYVDHSIHRALKEWLTYIMDDATKRSSGHGVNGPSMEAGILRAHLMALHDHGLKVLAERKTGL